MNFGQAISAMRDGECVRRAGWNGTGMHVYLEDWMEGTLRFGPGDRKYEPVLVMFTAQKTHQPGWLASQADMLAEDWEYTREADERVIDPGVAKAMAGGDRDYSGDPPTGG